MMDILGGISVETFLKEYWQKKPLLIRQSFPGFEPILPADELAGMSLEEEVESRIILEQGEESPWELRKGPFKEQDFAALPKDKWTLLIQGVDQWLPEAADLLSEFDFIPSWRIDDLMISYAVDGGSVGPHYDQYDVFLLQAEGKRNWRVGQMCSEQSAFLKEPKLRILEQFEEQENWVLEPGDMLYLPPRLAHYGIAQGECMTYSIGFRAPSQSELLHSLMEVMDGNCSEDQRYGDSDLGNQGNPGEINQDAIQRTRNLLISALNDDQAIADALGLLMSEAKYPEQLEESQPDLNWGELVQAFRDNEIERALHSRFSYSKLNGRLTFYCNHKLYTLKEDSIALAEYLCSERYLEGNQLINLSQQLTEKEFLLDLWQGNHFYCE